MHAKQMFLIAATAIALAGCRDGQIIEVKTPREKKVNSQFTELDSGFSPAVDHDAGRIAYVKPKPFGDTDIYLRDRKKGKTWDVSNMPGQEFAPDIDSSGTKVVYGAVERNKEKILLCDLEKRATRTLTEIVLDDTEKPVVPIISPDGRWVFYHRHDEVSLYDVSTGKTVYADGSAVGMTIVVGDGHLYPVFADQGLTAVVQNETSGAIVTKRAFFHLLKEKMAGNPVTGTEALTIERRTAEEYVLHSTASPALAIKTVNPYMVRWEDGGIVIADFRKFDDEEPYRIFKGSSEQRFVTHGGTYCPRLSGDGRLFFLQKNFGHSPLGHIIYAEVRH